MAQQVFDVMASETANLFQKTGAFSDNDLLLRCAFDDNNAIDTSEVVANFFKTFRGDGRNVRYLVASSLEQFFTHNLRTKNAQRLIGQFVFRKNRFRFREMSQTTFEQNIGHLVLKSGDWNDLFPLVFISIPLDKWKQCRFVFEHIDLVEKKQ